MKKLLVLAFVAGCTPVPADVERIILIDSGEDAPVVQVRDSGAEAEVQDSSTPATELDSSQESGMDSASPSDSAPPSEDSSMPFEDSSPPSEDSSMPFEDSSTPPQDVAPPVPTCASPAWTWSCGNSGCVTSVTCSTSIGSGWYVEFDTGNCPVTSCTPGDTCAVVAPGPNYYAGTCQ
jgi:hypothetical protein